MKPLDRLDTRILKEIQDNAHISNLELAEKIGLSPSPCSRRVRQLQEAGLIEGQVTLLNQQALGLSLTVYVHVHMASQRSRILENFEAQIATYPEVQECALITGSEADYILKVVMPDMLSYEQFLLHELNEIEGIASIRSSFVLRRALQRTQLPLHHLRHRPEV